MNGPLAVASLILLGAIWGTGWAATEPVVIPTPAEMRVRPGVLRACGARLEPRGEVPAYALDSLRDLFGGGESPACVELMRDGALGEQEYALEIATNGVRIAAGGDAGFVYAGSTLRQLAARGRSGVTLPCCAVRDRPAFAVRGVNWLLFVESRGWSHDADGGEEALVARATAALDVMAYLKLNAAFVDGFGWKAERYPGYGRLMRRLAAEARRRCIRLGFCGYNAGYGAQYFPWDGRKYRNVGADGREYACMGCDLHAESGKCGTCLSDDGTIAEKIAEMQAFVRAVEPGFLYIHGLDACERADCSRSWKGRCPECRRRWPNDDTTAPDGMAGAFADYYARLYDGIAAANGDVVVNFVSPNYTVRRESDEEWDYHVRYFRTLAAALGRRPLRIMLREQFIGEKGQRRVAQLREAIGSGVPLSFVVFSSGDGFYNSLPFTADIGCVSYLEGADEVYFGSGNVLQEPRQAAIAEYLWNPRGTRYPVSWPADFKGFFGRFGRLADGLEQPQAVFGADGLLERLAAKLYGARAGALVVPTQRPLAVETNPVTPIVAPVVPLTNRLLPGDHFAILHGRNRDYFWRSNVQERVDGFVDYGQALRLSAALSRDAAVRFGRAADEVDSPVFAPKAARRDVLLRMADTAACGAELADLSAQWTETVLAALEALRDGTRRPDAERRLHDLERAAQSAKAKYEERVKGMVDPYGGDWRCGLDTAEFILIEVAHIRHTLATGEWDDHPRRPWW